MRKSILISATALLFSLSASLLSAAATMGPTMKDGTVLKIESGKVHMLDNEGNDSIVKDGEYPIINNNKEAMMTVKDGQGWVDGKLWNDKQP